MNTNSNPDKARSSAGLAGAGGGTLVAIIANELPQSNILKVPLIYCAPSLSLVLSMVWVWLQVRIVSFFREREVKNLVEDLKEELELKLKDPTLSDNVRAQLQKELDDLNLISVQRLKERLHSLDVITADNFSQPFEESVREDKKA